MKPRALLGEATEPNAIPADGSELGEGQHSFTFQVQMADGTAYHYTVHTDEETVGAALVDLGLIEGEEGSYGLYVTTVLGTTLDYDADGYWWALSENGTDASVGVGQSASQRWQHLRLHRHQSLILRVLCRRRRMELPSRRLWQGSFAPTPSFSTGKNSLQTGLSLL